MEIIKENKYEVVIVGMGPCGIFAAYELLQRFPQCKILMVDKGKPIKNRKCPIIQKTKNTCPVINNVVGCSPCSIVNGFGGAGAFSDGKFNITTNYGGWLTDYIDEQYVLELIKYVDSINVKHGADNGIVYQNTQEVTDIEKSAAAVGLKLLKSNVRHLGTEKNLNILQSIYDYLEDKVEFLFNTEVTDIIVNNKQIKGIKINDSEYLSEIVILAPGRDGSSWLENIWENYHVDIIRNRVDIGVRVETSNIIMQDINKYLYEGKFLFNTSVGTQVRTFCSNPSGHVVTENYNSIRTVNGHSYSNSKLGSENTNFALLVSHEFTEPFDKPNEYAQEICKRANDLAGENGIIVQKFGDLMKGRRSTQKRINEGFIRPTLNTSAGDLGLVLPYNTMKSIIEMITALDKVTPGIASEHTLLYGVEAKFYSVRPKLNSFLETEITGLYCGGDGAGITRGLAQAAASGVHIARNILN